MVIEFVTSRCYKSHELAQASLLWGTVAEVSDVAHGPLVWICRRSAECKYLCVGWQGCQKEVGGGLLQDLPLTCSEGKLKVCDLWLYHKIIKFNRLHVVYLNSVSEQIWFLILFIFSLRRWKTIWNLWIKNWQVTRDWVSHLQVLASQTIPSISFLFLIVMFYWDNCPVSAGSDPLLCLLFEIDVPSEHPSPRSLTNVAAVWRYRSQINMEHLLHTVQVQVDSHKVLLMFLKEVTSPSSLYP